MPLGAILKGIASEVESLKGAIFCDEEGERVWAHVAEAGIDPFDLDIRGASFASLIPQLRNQGPRLVARVKTKGEVMWLQLLEDGYYLLLWTNPSPREAQIPGILASAADALAMDM